MKTSNSPNPLSRFFLMRHGETEWSISGQHTGRSDIPLTTRGEDGARELGRLLHDIPFAQVLTSPMQRAQRTCELAGFGFGFKMESDLGEWDYGDYEKRRTVDIRQERQDWDIYRHGCPKGESPQQVSDRADRLIERLRCLDGNVALFSHGHFGRVLAVRWIGLPLTEARKFMLSPGSLSVLSYAHNQPDEPAIALWNSVSADQFRSKWTS